MTRIFPSREEYVAPGAHIFPVKPHSDSLSKSFFMFQDWIRRQSLISSIGTLETRIRVSDGSAFVDKYQLAAKPIRIAKSAKVTIPFIFGFLLLLVKVRNGVAGYA